MKHITLNPYAVVPIDGSVSINVVLKSKNPKYFKQIDSDKVKTKIDYNYLLPEFVQVSPTFEQLR